MAKELGFDSLIANSMAGVADRDFALETMQWGSVLMLHVSRWSEDLIIYSSAEFGFVRLADAYTTGSSLMPQKKNCKYLFLLFIEGVYLLFDVGDSLELLRSKSGRIFGSIKGIPSTYNKDLQESVEPLLEHVKTLKDSLLIASRVLQTLTTFPDKMLAALTPDMLATDLAEYLVRKGKYAIPFLSRRSP